MNAIGIVTNVGARHAVPLRYQPHHAWQPHNPYHHHHQTGQFGEPVVGSIPTISFVRRNSDDPY